MLISFFSLFFIHSSLSSPIFSCYYGYYNTLRPENTNTSLCTHYMHIGNTLVSKQGEFLPPTSEIIEDYIKLKYFNPSLKLMLCVTGPNPNWSKLVSSFALMDMFANDSISYMAKYNLDGLDLDWEFPTWSWDAKYSDKKHLNYLLKILRNAFGSKYLLTMATSGPPTITKKAYDIPALNRYCDFINVMNYDFHVFSMFFNPLVGFNAPLHPMDHEYSVAGYMNSQVSIATYQKFGLALEKTVFGVPVYNLAFRLLNYKLRWPYSPAVGSVSAFSNYKETCNLTKNSSVYTEYWSNNAASPYIAGTNKIWISNENQRSVSEKARFAKSIGCAGLMFFQVSTDDWEGECGEGKFPLMTAARDEFLKTN